MSDIRIVCGDPEKGPASFTRFVLPFAYKLEKGDQVADGQPFYKPLNDLWNCQDEGRDFVWRRRYLTDETEEVLFRQAKWFELHEWPKSYEKCELVFNLAAHKKDESKGKGVVCIRAPRIVLFECDVSGDIKKQNSENSILQSGLLIVEVNFPKTSTIDEHDLGFALDDFMHFSELFRYWQKPFDGHELKGDAYIDSKKIKQDGKGGYSTLLKGLKSKQILGDKCAENSANDQNIYFDWWQSLLRQPVQFEVVGKNSEKNLVYFNLFPSQWADNTKARIDGKNIKSASEEQERQDWLLHADNRTFVWTCALIGKRYPGKTVYGADVLKIEFRKACNNLEAKDYGYWTRLLNVDPPDGNGSRLFEKEWTSERTYKRWEEWGTFYGYTPHSGAMLGAPLEDKTYFNADPPHQSDPFGPPMWRHFSGMYFDQTLLLLYLKTTLFRFSLELHQMTSKAMKAGEGSKDKWLKDFQKLRWQFTLFANLYQFPLLSNQQQGLEMYTLQRKFMDIDDLFVEIKDEIQSSYEYLMVQQDREQTEQGARLNVVATMGVVGALAFGFLGMNVVGDEINAWCSLDTWNWMTVLSTLTVFIAFTLLILFYSNSIAIRFTKISRYGKKEAENIRKTIKGDMG